MAENTNDPGYWNKRWLTSDTGWDMGAPSPPLLHYFAQLSDKQISILIPGCGNAYEAAWLFENGFKNLTLLYIAEQPTQLLRARFTGAPLSVLTADFFEHQGEYDLIIEQTFFCSLDPTLRPAYIEKAYSLLRPGGKLAGLLFDRNFPDHPPHGGHKAEYQQLLEKRFVLRTLEPSYNSIKPRAGTELFFIAVRHS